MDGINRQHTLQRSSYLSADSLHLPTPVYDAQHPSPVNVITQASVSENTPGIMQWFHARNTIL